MSNESKVKLDNIQIELIKFRVKIYSFTFQAPVFSGEVWHQTSGKFMFFFLKSLNLIKSDFPTKKQVEKDAKIQNFDEFVE